MSSSSTGVGRSVTRLFAGRRDNVTSPCFLLGKKTDREYEDDRL